jgi:hypothetical protein
MKLMCLLKRKPGMSPREFRDYYETVHAPLATRLLPFFSAYRRNYMIDEEAEVADHVEAPAAAPEIDVITEFVFETRADYEKMVAAFSDPAIAGEIADDEERFLDRNAIRIFFVDEVATPVAR